MTVWVVVAAPSPWVPAYAGMTFQRGFSYWECAAG